MIIDFDPVIFGIGPFQVRWYAMMYIVGFLIGTQLLKVLCRKGLFKLPEDKIDSMITWLLIGMVIGARVFYVFVYNWSTYSQNLGDIIAVWKGGLSFHGAIVGIAAGCYLFGRKYNLPMLHISDAAVTVGTQGLLFGRLGNFINGELYGRFTNLPWGMIFPEGGPYTRHPSQLYEAICEGLILFLFLWIFKKRMKTVGIQSSIFVMGYAFMRFFIEFFREADAQLGYYFGGVFTMGQILCFIMFAVGVAIFIFSKKRNLTI